MSDLISRSELMEEIKTLSIVLNGKQIFPNEAKDTVLRIINEQPTAYNIDKSGVSDDVCEWNQIESSVGLKTYKISCCGKTLEMPVSTARGLKYCPYCSKKIKVVE